MKTLKSSIQLLCFMSVLLWSCQSEAQRPKLKDASAEEIAMMQTKLQVKKLSLSEEQQEKLKTINLKYAHELVKLREKDPSERSLKDLKTIDQAQNEEVKTILSETQFENYLALKKKIRQRMRERRQNKRQDMQKK